jgi:hypothetical protein
VKQQSVVDALRKAAKELLFLSESEAPLEPFLWEDGGKLTRDRLRELAGAEEGAPVEESSLDDLLRTVPSRIGRNSTSWPGPSSSSYLG